MLVHSCVYLFIPKRNCLDRKIKAVFNSVLLNNSYSLTPPIVRPVTKYLCKKG